MQTQMTRGVQAYREVQVQSRSPLELVAMLYDGAVRFITEAGDAIGRKDGEAKRDAISRSLAIVSELQSTLNVRDGGEIAVSLDALYTYVNSRLLEASLKNDRAAIEDTLRVFSPLREAWSELAAAPPATSKQDPA